MPGLAKKGELAKAAAAARNAARAELGVRTHRGCGVAPGEAWLEQCLSRVVSEKFPLFSELQLTGTPVLGRTLMARLREDKISWCTKGEPPMGPKYYSELRRAYANDRPLVDQLQLDRRDPTFDQALCKKLAECMAHARLPRPVRGPLRSWLAGEHSLTQKDTLEKSYLLHFRRSISSL